MTSLRQRPFVLAIGGHDPSGGAGIQADIEAIHASGGRAVTVVTALTTQNAREFRDCRPVDPDALREQAVLLLDTLPIAAIKVGLIGNAAIASVIGELLAKAPGCPVVLDPVLAAGVGRSLSDGDTRAALRTLLPLTTVVTPNLDEALALVDAADIDEAACRLVGAGCTNVLLTGTHAPDDDVVNRLYTTTLQRRWRWPRLPHTYHGSGCTLAASLAAWLARGTTVEAACTLAQAFTWRSLAQGFDPDPAHASAHWHPDRLDTASDAGETET
jgi:hydroxymethylpyrimidine/phosphomethylpyrimidine kinase